MATASPKRATPPRTPVACEGKTTSLSMDELRQQAGNVATFLKTLANEQRLLVLCTLLEGEQSVGQINSRVDLSPSALSQHLASLREKGLVQTRREAQTIYYQLADPRVAQVMGLLKHLFCH